MKFRENFLRVCHIAIDTFGKPAGELELDETAKRNDDDEEEE
jgi:hypothetical protein